MVEARVNAMGSTPPPLPALRGGSSLPGIVIAGGGAVLAAVVARAATSGQLPLPGCTFKYMTGIACPGCGGTRSLSALAHFDVAGAFSLNPLVAAAAALLVLAAILALADRWLLGRCIASRVGGRVRWSRGASWTLGILVLLNWGYLVWTLP